MIELRSDVFKVVELRTKTKAQMFDQTEVGDLLQFKLDLKHTGYASRGTFASIVTAVNLTKGLSVRKSQSELINILSRTFVLEKVGDR